MGKRIKLRNLNKLPNSGEPVWNPEKDQNQLHELLNWYSYNRDRKDVEKYFLEYLKAKNHPDDFIDSVASLPATTISKTAGALCRILLLTDHELPKQLHDYINKEVENVTILVRDRNFKKREKREKKETPNVQDRLKSQLNEYIGEIEEQIDIFFENDWKNNFNFQEFFVKRDVKFAQAQNIVDYYEQGILKELKLALKLTNQKSQITSDMDGQLVEGYSHLGTSGLKKFIAFIEKIVSEAKTRYEISKQISANTRKARVRKPKPPGKQVEKLKYLKEHENLKSVPASSIVGATQLWVYNVKYRMLGVYICENPHGFSVKGSTLLNFSLTESISKKLRKPEEVIPKVLEAGKVALRKILPGVRAKENVLTGRINKDTILLKAL